MLKEFLQKKQNAQEEEAVTWFRRQVPYHEETEMVSRSQILLKPSERLIDFFFPYDFRILIILPHGL